MLWSKRAVASALRELTQSRISVLEQLKEILDNYHAERREQRYYDLLTGDWLEQFTHLVYVAMQEVRENVMSEDEPCRIPVSADLAEAKARFLDSGFHDHLRLVVAGLMSGRPNRNWCFEKDAIIIESGRREPLLVKMTRALSTQTPDLLITAPYFKCSKIEWVGALLRWRRWLRWDEVQYQIHLMSPVDVLWRRSQAAASSPVTNLVDMMRVLIPLYIPVALLEGFTAYRQAVLSFPVSRPRAVYSANALHNHLAWKLLVAEWRQQGTVLLYHQHGGGYGIEERHIIEEYESRLADRYYTLGWRSCLQHVQPLPAIRVSLPLRRRHRVKVLLNCLDMPKTVYRFHFQPMPGTIETLHRETSAFLTALPDRSALLVRPYFIDYGWGAVEMMRNAAPDAEFDDHKTGIAIRYAESRLVVHNYLGTGWLETLALDIPTVCFYDTDTYQFREDAQPFISSLENVGILHRSGGSAARFIGDLGEDIEKWWRRPEVQDTRRRFVAQYANYSSDWQQQWEKEFRAVLQESVR